MVGRGVQVSVDAGLKSGGYASATRLDRSAKLRICTQLLINQLQSGPYALDTSVM